MGPVLRFEEIDQTQVAILGRICAALRPALREDSVLERPREATSRSLSPAF